MEHDLMLPTRYITGNIRWRHPSYSNSYNMLRNPAYGGAYAYGKTEQVLCYENGVSQTRNRRRPRDRWVSFIPNAHEGYVSLDDFERVQRMIDGNRLSDHTVGPARRGRGLLACVLRCRRCGRILRTYYKGREGAIVRYACPAAHLDNKEARCIAFNGGLIDAAVARELLRVVEPAAIEAAILASQQQAQAQSEVVQALRRDLQAALYRAQRAERQYEATDPQNRLVAEELERRWNVALQEVRTLEARIAAESKIEESIGAASLEEFQNLAGDLEALWNDPSAHHSAKKRSA